MSTIFTFLILSLTIFSPHAIATISYSIDKRLIYNPRLLSDHALAPLGQFMSLEDYQSVLEKGLSSKFIPEWFSDPQFRETLKPYYKQNNGLCIYLVGLSGAGKSTLAEYLKKELEATDPLHREVIILDGDVMRQHLASELGFSKKDRSINVRRIGYVASLITKAGGLCICANIAPYEADREANRELISTSGTYFEVFVHTPLEVCEERDVKGLYKLAREGKLKEFTGISDPFEIPKNPDCVVSGADNILQSIETILHSLSNINYFYK